MSTPLDDLRRLRERRRRGVMTTGLTPQQEKRLLDTTARIERDVLAVARYGVYGAIGGAVFGLIISSERVSLKLERTAHNVLLGASLGALITGFLAS